MRQAEEQRLVEQLVAHAAVEALDIAVLHRSSRRDVMPLHTDLAAPCQHGIAGELGAIVADDQAGPASPLDECGKLSCHAVTGNRGVRDSGQALVGDVIDNVEDPEPPAVGHLVMDEVE